MPGEREVQCCTGATYCSPLQLDPVTLLPSQQFLIIFFSHKMDSQEKVLVLIIKGETKSCDQNIANLKSVFADPYFVVEVVPDVEVGALPAHATLSREEMIEKIRMERALTLAAEGPYRLSPQRVREATYVWASYPVLLIKDSSVTNLSPGGVEARTKLQTSLALAESADLFFLCKWLDACDKYTDVPGMESKGSSLKWSIQPTATQAVLYRPRARDFVRDGLLSAPSLSLSQFLNKNILEEQLSATVFVPNLIDFDIDLAVSNDDFRKLNECSKLATPASSTISQNALIWAMITLILLLVVAWSAIQVSPLRR